MGLAVEIGNFLILNSTALSYLIRFGLFWFSSRLKVIVLSQCSCHNLGHRLNSCECDVMVFIQVRAFSIIYEHELLASWLMYSPSQATT